MASSPTLLENHSARRSIAVIGCGNWRIAADRTGPEMIQSLAGRYGDEVATYDIGTSALGLLDCLNSQDLVLVVDSCRGLARPGEICLVEPDLDAVPEDMPSLHQVGPVETLLVGALLYPERMPEEIQMVLVETEGLAEAALEGLIEEVASVIDREIGKRYPGSGAVPLE